MKPLRPTRGKTAEEDAASGITIGVDLGGTKIQTVAVHDKEVIGGDRVLTPSTNADDVIAAIITAATHAMESAGASLSDLAGVGIGSPGRIDREMGVVSNSPNVAGFKESVELGARVSQALGGVLVRVDNDVRVAMLGEHARGNAAPYSNVLGVFVGTGVGGGLILDGKLRGGRGAGGEIGHTIVDVDGRMCGDGKRGHLEAYAGRARMEARARELVSKGHKTDLFKIMNKKGRERLSSGVFAAALASEDKMTESLIADATWALGIALASAQNLLDVEAIIIGGGLGDRLGKPFIDGIAAQIHPQLIAPDRAPDILGTGLGDLSGAVGAAVLAGG